MTPDLERFLDLATRPLDAEPGMRDEAKGELMGRVSHTGVPHEILDLRVPLERLETSPPRKPWPRRVALLMTLVVSIVSLGTGSAVLSREYALMTMATMLTIMRSMGSGPTNMENPLLLDYVRKNAPGLPLGRDLMSESRDRDDAEAWLADHPDDLAMIQEKVTRKLRTSSPWTGLEEPEKSTIARLDPDNALWSLMQVVPHIDKATSSSSRYSMPPGPTPVTDEAEFQNALRLFSEAAAKSSLGGSDDEDEDENDQDYEEPRPRRRGSAGAGAGAQQHQHLQRSPRRKSGSGGSHGYNDEASERAVQAGGLCRQRV